MLYLKVLACGTPVVVSDVGGIRDYAGPECGALCTIGDANAHADETVESLLNKSRREMAGKTAENAQENYAWPIVREQVELI